MSERRLIFLHLSDIHFSKRSAAHYDLDRDLREQLEMDARIVRERFDTFTGILVSGDIAFSGQPHEYDVAKSWLTNLCRELDCPEEDVWTVPGNHDVDRAVIKNSLLIRDLHQRLRARNANDVDRVIGDLFTDREAFEIIHRPFGNYNIFASGYGCTVGSRDLHWDDDQPLNDGSTLRFRGVNSALISNEGDDESGNRLVVGTLQSLPPLRPGVAYLLLCHHPPDWVWDRDCFNDNLKARVAVTLFGHKHVQRIERVNDTLRVVAGAVQPSRDEGRWLPRYNFIALSVVGTPNARKLRVEILPRVWNDLDKKFLAEFDAGGRDQVVQEIPLDPWEPAAAVVVPEAVAAVTAAEADASAPEGSGGSAEGRSMNPERRLTFRFFDLPYSRRMEVVTDLALVADEDEGLREEERYKRYFQRAREGHLLERFWNEVERRHSDDHSAENPFARESRGT